MTLTCKPAGRGNWNSVVIIVTGKRVPPPGLIDFYIGQVFKFGPMTLRIVGIEP